MHNRKQIFIMALQCVFMRFDSFALTGPFSIVLTIPLSLPIIAVGRQYSSTSTQASVTGRLFGGDKSENRKKKKRLIHFPLLFAV